MFILPYYYRFFLSDHCWRRLFIAFGYFRAIVGFTCHCYNATVLLATFISRYTRIGGKDIFFWGLGKLRRRVYLPKLSERFRIPTNKALESVAIDQKIRNNRHVSDSGYSRVLHVRAGLDLPVGNVGKRIRRGPRRGRTGQCGRQTVED